MDSLPTLLTEKTKDSKPKIKQKRNQAPKIGTGSESQTQFRQNRVFGTAWNTNVNIPKKPVSDNIITKPKPIIPQRHPKQPTQATDTKSPENPNLIKNKKNDTFSQENDSVEAKTPVTSSHVRGKSKVQATPFYSAVNCSKCRFDRLETSSYWVGQIKLAETVGKHFVACGFFKLAFESQAEPIRNLRIELKRYLSRHGHLYEEKEWRKVAGRYGLLKDESITSEMNSAT